MLRTYIASGLLFFALGTVPGWAATVSSLNGEVSANAGSGFRRTALGAQIQPGQRVLVSANSNVRITYDNGCTVVFEQQGIYVVPEQPACAGLEPTTTQYAVGAAVVIGAGVGIYYAAKPSSP